MPTIMVKGREVILDEEDIPLLESRSWFWTPQGYLATSIPISKGKRRTVCFHRLVLDDPPTPAVDHINRVKHDNRRCNLRACSDRENNLNRRGWTNPEKGVSFRRGKWQVIVREGSKIRWLGAYKDKDEAVRVATTYFVARDNSPIHITP